MACTRLMASRDDSSEIRIFERPLFKPRILRRQWPELQTIHAGTAECQQASLVPIPLNFARPEWTNNHAGDAFFALKEQSVQDEQQKESREDEHYSTQEYLLVGK